ncbi:MAG: hypothetical protein COB02_17450 [Candidatus Cloacimonadota bacterium]|nr:MAG: hypothetical protein COB02_17450 [Candidatus Cloacimonadota bacterium]
MKKVLIFDMENSLAREMSKYFLDRNIEVVGVGVNEKVLGSLNSYDLFTFRKFDLAKQDFLRSYLYGIDSILIINSSEFILEKIDHLYQCLIHQKSRVPQVLFLSSYEVFGDSRKAPYLEDEIPNPLSEDAKVLRGAEIIIENYTKHLETKGSVLRIPKILSRKNEENEFKEFFKYLSKNTRFVVGDKDNLSLQWITKDRLFDVCYTILKSSWNDFEVFHACDYENDIREAFEDLTDYLNSKSKIIKASKKEMFFSGLMKVLPFLEEMLEDYVRETRSLIFLKSPRISCVKTDSFFKFNEYTWKGNLSKKKNID